MMCFRYPSVLGFLRFAWPTGSGDSAHGMGTMGAAGTDVSP
jgi:hypothetical protein